MAIADSNKIIRDYLIADAGIIALFLPDAPRIYCPRLPEKATLPAISFFTRGGTSTPYIPGLPSPSVQFDCWATDTALISGSINARQVYRVLYDALQGIQNIPVGAVPPGYQIMSAIEEVQGQDLVDELVPNYFRVLCFFSIMIRADT